jgi:hypothetical protein
MAKKIKVHYICPLCKEKFTVVCCACKRNRTLGLMSEEHLKHCAVRGEMLQRTKDRSLPPEMQAT